jgi:hypothetical protein
VLDSLGQELRARLLDIFQTRNGEPLEDVLFNETALHIFRFQFERNSPFAAYCRRRGRTPDHVHNWTEIPAVPTAAFREVSLVTGDPGRADAVFRTSGTTRGGERRGTHHIPDVSLYHAAILPHFRRSLLPDGARLPMLALIPPAAELPDSSLSHMVQVIMAAIAAGGAHFASVGGGLNVTGLEIALRGCEERSEPVCLLGTSFSFVHWLDQLVERGEHFQLPAGSRLMDTGGYKGRSREVPADELRVAYGDLLGLHPDFCVNEYGMTELCSQAYDTTLRERYERGAAGPRRKQGPPWMRTRVVDPDSLQPSPPGEVGLLQHCDLANLGSVLLVQTEDLGRAVDDGFLVLGRAAGAPPRGCSIAMDDLLGAVRDRH